MMKVTDEPILLSPPRIKRVAQCRRPFYGDNTRSANFEVIESLFRGEDVPCCQVGVDHERGGLDDGSSSSSGRVFPPSVTSFPMTFERQRQQHPQEVDEEVCIGGCYYNMDRKHGASSTTITIIPSWEHKHASKARASRNQCVSSFSEVCRKLYPFPFILMCALLLFGIGEILRRVSVIHGDRMV